MYLMTPILHFFKYDFFKMLVEFESPIFQCLYHLKIVCAVDNLMNIKVHFHFIVIMMSNSFKTMF